MTCENCSHECTMIDFVTFRNLCEHLYLDALAKKPLADYRFNEIPDIVTGTHSTYMSHVGMVLDE